MKINLIELESLAISPDIPILGEVASLKQIGDTLFVALMIDDREAAAEIERLLEARYPLVRVEVNIDTEISQTNGVNGTKAKKTANFSHAFGKIAVENKAN